jgi:cytoskeletal protein CcmA (bactofilin family)
MTKFAVFVVCSLVLVLGSARVVLAQNNDSGKIVEVKKGDVVNHDYFASGDLVTISGKINGDAFIFAQKIIIDGEVNGDLIAAGGEILIPGKVDHDARLAASKISLRGTVDGSVTVGTGEFTFERSGRIGNSVVMATDDVSLQGYIGKDLSIWARKISISNNVGGSIRAAVEDLTLDPGAIIGGDINYWAANNLTVNMGSTIAGQTVKHEVKKSDSSPASISKSVAGALLAIRITGFLFTLLFGLLAIKLLPVFSLKAADFASTKPFKSFWVGLLILIVTPFLMLLLILTIIGIPLALTLLFLVLLVFCFSKIFVAISVGNYLEKKFKLNSSIYLKFIGGLMALSLVSMIPVIGGVVGFLVFFIGVGALSASGFGLYKNLTAKKLI